MNSNKTRQTLIQKVKEQYDQSSWEEFVENYRGYLYVVINNMSINHQDSEDLTQTVLLKIWKAIPDFNYTPERCSFRSWLLTITRNTTNSFLSANKSRQNRESQKAQEVSESQQPDIEEMANRQWKIFITEKAIKNIKEDFSENVFDIFLKFSRGEKAPLIAKENGIAENSVHVYSSRVKKAIKKEIIRLDSHLS
jgi:RNA polymerase sigma factor (sigma-70 family)